MVNKRTPRPAWWLAAILAVALLTGLGVLGVRLRPYWVAKYRGEGADLHGAWLVHASLDGADLSDANLKGAKLTGANLEHAWLSASLQGACLRGARLSGAHLASARMDWADLRG